MSSNKLAITLTWMLESDSCHRAFRQSPQHSMVVSSKDCGTVTMRRDRDVYSSVRNHLFKTKNGAPAPFPTFLICRRQRYQTASIWGGDSSVVTAPDSWLKGRGFESLQERRANFLLQGQLYHGMSSHSFSTVRCPYRTSGRIKLFA